MNTWFEERQGHGPLLLAALLLYLWALPALGFDPMAPPGYERGNINGYSASKGQVKKVTSGKRDFVLRQIVFHEKRKSAVINGYILNVGSYLKGAYVQAINETSVELIVAGKKRVLTLETKLPKVRQ